LRARFVLLGQVTSENQAINWLRAYLPSSRFKTGVRPCADFRYHRRQALFRLTESGRGVHHITKGKLPGNPGSATAVTAKLSATADESLPRTPRTVPGRYAPSSVSLSGVSRKASPSRLVTRRHTGRSMQARAIEPSADRQ